MILRLWMLFHYRLCDNWYTERKGDKCIYWSPVSNGSHGTVAQGCTISHHRFLICPLLGHFCVLSQVKYRKELFAMPVSVALFLAKIQGDRGSTSAVDFPGTFTPQRLLSASLPKPLFKWMSVPSAEVPCASLEAQSSTVHICIPWLVQLASNLSSSGVKKSSDGIKMAGSGPFMILPI